MLMPVIINLLVTFLMAEPILAIHCYNCESVSDTNCGEEFHMEDHFKIDCDQVGPPRFISNDLEHLNATACMKKIYKEHKTVKYVRTCYFGDGNDTTIGCRMDPTLMDLQDLQCLICDNENFCNTALSRHDIQTHPIKYIPVLAVIIFEFMLI